MWTPAWTLLSSGWCHGIISRRVKSSHRTARCPTPSPSQGVHRDRRAATPSGPGLQSAFIRQALLQDWPFSPAAAAEPVGDAEFGWPWRRFVMAGTCTLPASTLISFFSDPLSPFSHAAGLVTSLSPRVRNRYAHPHTEERREKEEPRTRGTNQMMAVGALPVAPFSHSIAFPFSRLDFLFLPGFPGRSLVQVIAKQTDRTCFRLGLRP